MKDIINLSLVFAAVALGIYLAVSTLYKFTVETMESHRDENEELKRFISMNKLVTLRFSCSLFAGVAIIVILLLCGVLNAFIYIPLGIALATAGWFLPLLYFRWKAAQRKEMFENKLLDLTMGLANGMRSGLALPQALEATAKRLGEPMQEELHTVLREYRLGIDLADALQRLNERMPGEDLNLLVTSVRLTTKTGGSLVEVMEKMVEMIRGRREFQERLKNMTAQGKFEALAMSLAPVAAFILLYVIDSSLMRPMLTTGTGWCGIGIACTLVCCGYFIIKKIVTIEV